MRSRALRFVLLLGLLLAPAHALAQGSVVIEDYQGPYKAGVTPVNRLKVDALVTGTVAPTPTASTASPTAFGQGFFTTVNPATPNHNLTASFLFLDDLNVVGVGTKTGVAANIYRSTDGGTTVTVPTTATVGSNNALRNLVRAASGLYIIGNNNNPASVQTSPDLGLFTNVPGNGLPVAAGADTFVFQALNTILLTENVTQNVCRATVSGMTLGAWICTVPPNWTGPTGTGNGISAFSLSPSTGAGAPGGIWIGVDKATPSANVIRSTDDGASFSFVTTLPEGTSGVKAHAVRCLSGTPAVCLIGLNGKIYRSTDSGATWALVATYTQSGLVLAFLDYGQGTVVGVGGGLSGNAVPPGCAPTCSAASGITWIRSTDSGATWAVSPGGWSAQGGNGTDGWLSAVTSPTAGRAMLSTVCINCAPPSGPNPSAGWLYSPTLAPGGATLFGISGLPVAVLDHGELIHAGPVQAGLLLNSQTTGAAATAVVKTLTGVAGFRVHVYSIEARCNTAADTTTGVTMTDAATTVWSTGPADVPAASTNYGRPWVPGYTAGDGATVVITLAACTAGTGTLIVQADQF